MIRFKQFIAEAFDSSFPFKKGDFGKYLFVDDDGINYVVHSEVEEDSVDFEFNSYTKNKSFYKLSGNAKQPLKIYSTIRKIIFKVLDENRDISSVTFSAADDRTINLYNKFAMDIARKYKGKVEKSDKNHFYIRIRN